MINKVDISEPLASEISICENYDEFRKNIASSVFNSIDTDGNDTISQEEASLAGFSTLGNKDISLAEFKNKVDLFLDKTRSQKGILSGFENCFGHVLDMGYDTKLTKEQRQELLFRIEMFEAIQKVIGEDIDYVPDMQTDIKNKIKSGEKISNEELAGALSQNTISRKISDGVIGAFKQGNLGDCWFLSMLNTYISSDIGAKNIKDRIINNKDGTYTVLFNNPFEQTKLEKISVTNDELAALDDHNNSNEFQKCISGDIDVKILEIAATKLLDKYLDNSEKEILRLEESDNKLLYGSDYIKEILIHRAFGYKDNPIWFRKISANEIESSTAFLYKNSRGKAEIAATDKPDEIRLTDKKITDFGSLAGLIRTGGFRPEEINIATGDNEDEKKKPNANNLVVSSHHQLNFNKLTNYGIIFTNPHIAPFPIGIEFDKFEKLFDSLTVYPQKNLITVNECK